MNPVVVFNSSLTEGINHQHNSPIKWGSATQALPFQPACWEEARKHVQYRHIDPQPHDVMVAQVQEISQHTRIELAGGRKALLYPGDLVGVAFGNRYATHQYHGVVPSEREVYDMLSQGGVCGEVLSAAGCMREPTLLRPLGFLLNESGEVVNLRDYGIRPIETVARVSTIVVVGSSMDAGKTTMVSGIVHGLSSAGFRVNAGKVTGTACAKDLLNMLDAGANSVLDFSRAGFSSTAAASEQEIHELCNTIVSHLSADSPDYVVLEIADGVVQRETRMVLDYLVDQGQIDHLCLAVHDAMAAPTCIDFLRSNWGLEVRVVSGMATMTPLSTSELIDLIDAPCWDCGELASAAVGQLFVPGAEQFQTLRQSS